MPEAGEAAEEEDVADPGFQSLLEGTGLDLRFSLFSLGQEDFSLGLDHWMAQVRIFRGDVITGWRRCEFFAET